MTIVCATDFSDHARQGATVAALLAHKRRVPLVLVHVTSAKEGSRESYAAQAALDGDVERLAALGAQVKAVLRHGSAADEVVACIKLHEADLVLAGAPPHDPPSRVIHGTVPKVARASPVPVLTIRAAAPFEAWLRGERPLRVMLGVDGSRFFKSARQWLEGFAQMGSVEVIGARVYPPASG